MVLEGCLMTSLRLLMRAIFRRLLAVAGCGLLIAVVTGCGNNTDPPDNSTSDPNSNNHTNQNNGGGGSGGDLAPASIGDNVIHGAFQSPHDATQTLHWHITTSGTTTGTYTYEEENLPTNTGTYTWTKTGPDTAVLSTSNNGDLQFSYTARQAGNYVYGRTGYTETGTFTTDN